MNTEKLFRAIGQVGDDLIARADAPVRKTNPWVRWAALAACCVLVIGVASLARLFFGGAKSAAPSLAAMNQTTADVAQAEMPAEEKAEEPALAPQTPMEAPMEEPADMPAAEEAPESVCQNAGLLDGAFTSAVLQAKGETVTVADGPELTRLLDLLRELPTDGAEEGPAGAQEVEIFLYEGKSCTVWVRLPAFGVSPMGEEITGVWSEEAEQACKALLETYFS